MAVFKCKMCGGDLPVTENAKIVECEFCGTTQTIPATSDNVAANLFNRANNLRIKCEFDKAEQIYQTIVNEHPNESEAYWGLVLCKYGIEYVDDPTTHDKIPTCHRTSYESVITDVDYLAALEHADFAQKLVYEKEAARIDLIQKNILETVKNEKPFDVFICYKETDADGKRTTDSVRANDIYYHLTEQGFKVFYAAITLEDKLGQQYEPYIFAALNSAKVMLVIGSQPNYFNAVWVKNEWSRFLKLMKNDRKKLLIPCYEAMDAYELPEEFAHLQAQDMSKIGFINDITRGIRKLFESDKQEKASPEQIEAHVITTNANTSAMLERVFIFLEDGDWQSADEYCEKVLDFEPKNAQAYLGKLMAELEIRNKQDLKNHPHPFDNSLNYQKAVRFGNEELKKELEECIKCINTRNENARLEKIYNEAYDIMRTANTEKSFINAAEIYALIPEYKDSASRRKKCIEYAESIRKDSLFNEAKKMMEGNNIPNYEQAIKILETVTGWKNADELIETCKHNIEEINAQLKADRLERERKNELKRQQATKEAKKNKIIAIISTLVMGVIIIGFVVFITVIQPSIRYNDATALMEQGNYEQAVLAFESLKGYKDSADKFEQCNTEIYGADIWNKTKGLNIGDAYIFGAYEQDNNISNGKEEIEWTIIDINKEEAKILVITEYALDCKPYNTEPVSVTWESCSLREWLNNDFYNSAFSDEEKAMIPVVTVAAHKNPKYSTSAGNDTRDSVFILSIEEAKEYFKSDKARKCNPTAYAISNSIDKSDENYCWWWLRSPGDHQGVSTFVNKNGELIKTGYFVEYEFSGIRPSIWIDLAA